MNDESAGAPSPFSKVPMYLPGIEIAVGDGDAVGVGETVGDGDAVGVGDEEVVGVGDGEALFVAVGVGDAVGDGDAVGVGVGVTFVVVRFVGEPVPGQVCERRIPESAPSIFAKEPTCTMRMRSDTNV